MNPAMQRAASEGPPSKRARTDLDAARQNLPRSLQNMSRPLGMPKPAAMPSMSQMPAAWHAVPGMPNMPAGMPSMASANLAASVHPSMSTMRNPQMMAMAPRAKMAAMLAAAKVRPVTPTPAAAAAAVPVVETRSPAEIKEELLRQGGDGPVKTARNPTNGTLMNILPKLSG